MLIPTQLFLYAKFIYYMIVMCTPTYYPCNTNRVPIEKIAEINTKEKLKHADASQNIDSELSVLHS